MGEINRGESDMEDGMRVFSTLLCPECGQSIRLGEHEDGCDNDNESEG